MLDGCNLGPTKQTTKYMEVKAYNRVKYSCKTITTTDKLNKLLNKLHRLLLNS